MSVDRWFEKEIDKMLVKIAKTKTKDEVEKIFDRILTPREINDMARRMEVWELLEENISYREIQDRLRVSSAIVSKVANKIGYGFRRTSSKTKIKSKKGKNNQYGKIKKYVNYKGVRMRIPG